MNNPRLIAARVMDQILDGRSLADCLSPALLSLKDPRDRAFVQAVCYGVCRFYTKLDVILSHLLEKPMKAKDSDVYALLLVGLYQLMAMRIPEYAAVTETVNAAEKFKKPWARGLVNAILREYCRRRENLENDIADDEEAYYAHPQWWIEKIKKAWPMQWENILKENNQHPPFALRVNSQKLTREQYLEKLHQQTVETVQQTAEQTPQQTGYTAHVIPETSNGIILNTPISTEDLPGFSAGEISVQDGAAQLAIDILRLETGQRVLDACAAPGGKLTHILEKISGVSDAKNSTGTSAETSEVIISEGMVSEVIAVEKEAKRISPIKENLARLNLNAQCICADAMDVENWWDGQLFDRILLDAPCSASGVVRRHPDIKLLRQPGDIPVLAHQQIQLLKALWPLLKPDGLLLYATCSIFPEENTEVLQKFLEEQKDAMEEKIPGQWGCASAVGRQILPGMHEMDGFYYALLRKTIEK